MPSAARILQASSENLTSAPPPAPPAVDTDVVVILVAMLCAMVSVAGLALVARCACLWPSGRGEDPQAPPDKGLRKKTLRQLPKVSYGAGTGGGGAGGAECPICLSEFEEGDQLRVLPQCGHGFHVGCVDAWLRSHSSCPSCRRVLVVAAPPSLCQGCGESSVDATAPRAAAEGGGQGRR